MAKAHIGLRAVHADTEHGITIDSHAGAVLRHYTVRSDSDRLVA